MDTRFSSITEFSVILLLQLVTVQIVKLKYVIYSNKNEKNKNKNKRKPEGKSERHAFTRETIEYPHQKQLNVLAAVYPLRMPNIIKHWA